MQKKACLPPTLTALGGAVEKTRGRLGKAAELINYYFWIA
jgi:hypothetical protein